jgi:hypothetical protein
MKKLSLALMTGVLLVSLAGCASSTKKEETTKVKNAETTTVVETTIEETTEEKTTKEKETKEPHPSKQSKCKTPEAAIQPVCQGLMDTDVDEMFSTFPSDLLEYKQMKTLKKELKDVVQQLGEMKEAGMTFEVKITGVSDPESTNMSDLNQDFADLGVDFKISEIKKVGLSATVSAGGESVTQDIMNCIAGKIGKYWYFVSCEQ